MRLELVRARLPTRHRALSSPNRDGLCKEGRAIDFPVIRGACSLWRLRAATPPLVLASEFVSIVPVTLTCK